MDPVGIWRVCFSSRTEGLGIRKGLVWGRWHVEVPPSNDGCGKTFDREKQREANALGGPSLAIARRFVIVVSLFPGGGHQAADSEDIG